jgi:hypothetical protein
VFFRDCSLFRYLKIPNRRQTFKACQKAPEGRLFSSYLKRVEFPLRLSLFVLSSLLVPILALCALFLFQSLAYSSTLNPTALFKQPAVFSRRRTPKKIVVESGPIPVSTDFSGFRLNRAVGSFLMRKLLCRHRWRALETHWRKS